MSNQFMNAEEVAGATGMSKSYAFKLIKTLNAELAAQGSAVNKYQPPPPLGRRRR